MPKRMTSGAPSDFGDQALWQDLSQRSDPRAFAEAWLAAMERLLGDVAAAVLVMAVAPGGALVPIGKRPQGAVTDPLLIEALEDAARRGIAILRPKAAGRLVAAFPYRQGETLLAVAAFDCAAPAPGTEGQLLMQLRWAGAWLRPVDAAPPVAPSGDAPLEIVGSVLAALTVDSAERDLVSRLALETGCQRVSLVGFEGDKPVLRAVSGAAEVNRRLSVAQGLCAVAAEAADQKAILRLPAAEGDPPWVTLALADFAGSAPVAALPFFVEGRPVMALILEAEGSGDLAQAVATCHGIGSLLAPALHARRRAEAPLLVVLARRSLAGLGWGLGPRRIKTKLVLVLCALALLAASLIEGAHEVVAEAKLEGAEIRWLVAPFDGFLLTAPLRPGDEVARGDLLAGLDTRDLVLERATRQSEYHQHQVAADVATAKGERSQVNELRALMESDVARLDLLESNIARAELRAPFDGLVVSGDLSDRLGGPVAKGDRLLSLTPRNALRVSLMVEDADVDGISVGQSGHLRLTALPGRSLVLTVKSLTPVTEVSNGSNAFRVEALLDAPPQDLRPGMKGIARLGVDHQPLIVIWLTPVLDRLRLVLWEWRP